jgi:hypothetical protein
MAREDTLPVGVYESRLIAFLDVLGFGERLESEPLRDLHRDYAALIDEARTAVIDRNEAGQTNFAHAQFAFDSIILVSHPLSSDEGPKAVFHFIGAIAQLLENAFARRMPLRGAIALGDFLIDENHQIFLSGEFPKLVRAERVQDWCGAIVLPNAVQPILDGLYGAPESELPRTASGLVIEYEVPFKSEGKQWTEKHWCINWVWFSDAPNLTGPFDWLREPKRAHTQRFIDHVHELPRTSSEAKAPTPMGPIVGIRLQGARAGWRMKFIDARGCGIDPPEGTQIHFEIRAMVAAPPSGE